MGETVDGFPVQPQKLRQNQHSAALKQRQHKILKVLPQGAVKDKSAEWCETPASTFVGKKSITGQFSNVFVCAFVECSLWGWWLSLIFWQHIR